MRSLSCAALADAIEAAAQETPAAPLVPAMAQGAPVERLRAYAGHDEEAEALLDRLCATPEITTDLKAAALRHLGMLERDYHVASPVRRGPLAKGILAAIRELRAYFPPPPPTKTRDEVLEELRALDAEAIERIEERLPERIDPKEIQ